MIDNTAEAVYWRFDDKLHMLSSAVDYASQLYLTEGVRARIVRTALWDPHHIRNQVYRVVTESMKARRST